jgi:hypothetical protein
MPENEPHFQDYAFDKELDRSYEAEGNHRSKQHKRGVMAELQDLVDFGGRKVGSKGPLGFQIKNVRTNYDRETPDWIRSNESIQKILLTAFPRLKTDENQRKRAGRWARVIQLYFRLGWTIGEIADEINVKQNVVSMIIRSIVRTARGERADGSGPRTKTVS